MKSLNTGLRREEATHLPPSLSSDTAARSHLPLGQHGICVFQLEFVRHTAGHRTMACS